MKPTLLYITCENYIKLVKITQAIKHLKFPDAYKGKGVNLEYDKLSLKNGKKSQQWKQKKYYLITNSSIKLLSLIFTILQ